jgi:hypothetical protein
MRLMLCLCHINEEMDGGKIPKLGRFNDAGLEQAHAASVMTSVK